MSSRATKKDGNRLAGPKVAFFEVEHWSESLDGPYDANKVVLHPTKHLRGIFGSGKGGRVSTL